MLQRLNQITARWLFALLAGAIALGFWLSAPLAPAAGLAPSFLAVMIFAVASSLDMGAFRRAGREPGLWLRSFLLSYIAFPALAWTAGRLLFPHDPLLRLGLLLLALVPAANTASVYTALAGGDVATALTGIALGNLLLPALLLAFFASQGAGAVSPAAMWRTLALFVILPTAAGTALGTRLGAGPAAPSGTPTDGAARDLGPRRLGELWRQAAPLIARACVMAIMLLNAAALRAAQMEVRVGRVVLLILILALIEGLMYGLTGWWTARRLPHRPAQGKAFCFLHATRNTALAIALAGTALGPQASLPAMAAFLIQEPLAAVVAARWSHQAGHGRQASDS
ncbi:MAG TPA: bile acid:sodium symporter [Limnochordales bacterium]|nr:bile acid:sodium symporter [Limnochordales bacterium]